MTKIEDIASKHLGKAGDGSVVSPYVTPDAVESELLVAIPRFLNREQYGIDENDLQFQGFDTWHGYEVSFLTSNGFPVNCVAKIVYACNSESIVESKSLKLYLNSFNMQVTGNNKAQAIEKARRWIERDLSNALNTWVEVYLHDVSQYGSTQQPLETYEYECLDDSVDIAELVFDEYNESPDILSHRENEYYDENTIKVWTPSLRSNCRVTNQPDWGDVFIYMKGDSVPTNESLLKYIVSMRKENHFHEEICECIYTRLNDVFSPDELFVACLYTRRGGIDINPVRYSHAHLANMASGLRNSMVMTEKTKRQ